MTEQKIPPTKALRTIVKRRFVANPKIMEFLGGSEKDIQINRFSDIGENDPPLIVICTPEDMSKELNTDPPSYRNFITLTVDVFCPIKQADILDEITFEIKNELSAIVFPKRHFQPIKHEKTNTNSYAAGQKLVASSSSEYSTFLDLEYNESGTYPYFVGVDVNGIV